MKCIIVPCLPHHTCNFLDHDLQTFALLRYQAAVSHIKAWNKPASHQKTHTDQLIPCDRKNILPSPLTLVLRWVLPPNSWEETVHAELYLAAPYLACVENIACQQLCLSPTWYEIPVTCPSGPGCRRWLTIQRFTHASTHLYFPSSRVSNICQSSGWLWEESSSSSHQYCLTGKRNHDALEGELLLPFPTEFLLTYSPQDLGSCDWSLGRESRMCHDDDQYMDLFLFSWYVEPGFRKHYWRVFKNKEVNAWPFEKQRHFRGTSDGVDLWRIDAAFKPWGRDGRSSREKPHFHSWSRVISVSHVLIG